MSEPQETTSATATAAPDEEIKPYQIHVSSKYLDLTSQKLDLTRLPREVEDPSPQDWWAPKSTVEPLIDFWQEQYSWRDKEKEFNASLPQFRTSIHVPTSESPVRIHFIHSRSPHANAVPLLLIPPFPFTNLSLGHLVSLFTDPDDAGTTQPFHLVIPSLPGLGFSDALPNNTPLIPTTAATLDTLMKRLTYNHYLVSNSGPSANSPSEIDFRLAKYLSFNYSESCLGMHLISPPLASPRFQDSPLEWVKWMMALFLQATIFGYSKDDLAAVRRDRALAQHNRSGKDKSAGPWNFGIKNDGDYEPNTLAYALCDSPAGLLLFFLLITRVLGPLKELTPDELITMAELTWLPGPEATFRYWAYCAYHREEQKKRPSIKPRVAITVFQGESGSPSTDEENSTQTLPRPATSSYVCTAWAKVHYDVMASSRVSGQPGLLAWERPEVIVDGTRALAKEILKSDKRMQEHELPGHALLQVVVDGDRPAAADISGTTVQAPIRSSSDLPGEAPKKQVADGDNKYLSPTQAQLSPKVDGAGERGSQESATTQVQ